MQRLIAAALLALLATQASAQVPQKVVPGYQSCSNASGATVCSFIPADLTHGLPVQVLSGGSAGDPCGAATKVYTPINVVTATNVIIVGVTAKKKYVCGIFLCHGCCRSHWRHHHGDGYRHDGTGRLRTRQWGVVGSCNDSQSDRSLHHDLGGSSTVRCSCDG
jgi:hypothetical protein